MATVTTLSRHGTDTNVPNGRHDARDTGATEALVTAAEAAAMLGLSERTIRRKIAANELPSVKSGRSRLIPVSAVMVSRVDDTPDSAVMVSRHDTSDTEPATVLTLVDRIGSLERQVGRLEQERDGLSARLAVAEERLRALPAGQDAPSAAREPLHATHDVKPAADTSSWWRRVLAWLRGM